MSSLASVPPASALASDAASLRAPAPAKASAERIKALEEAETAKLKKAEEAKALALALINTSMEKLDLVYQWYGLAEEVSSLDMQKARLQTELEGFRQQESTLQAELDELNGERQELLSGLAMSLSLPLFQTTSPPALAENKQTSSSSSSQADLVEGSNLIKENQTTTTTAIPTPVMGGVAEPAGLLVGPNPGLAVEDITPGFSRNPWWKLTEIDLAAMLDTKTSHPNFLVQKWLNQAALAVRAGDWATAADWFSRLTIGAGKDSYLAWLGHAASFTANPPSNQREVKAALEKAYALKEDYERIGKALLSIYDEKAKEKALLVTPALVGNKPLTQIDNKIGTQLPTSPSLNHAAPPAGVNFQVEQEEVEADSVGMGGEEADYGEDLTFEEERESGTVSYAGQATPAESSSEGHAEVESVALPGADMDRKTGEGSQPIANFSSPTYASNRTNGTNGRTKTGR